MDSAPAVLHALSIAFVLLQLAVIGYLLFINPSLFGGLAR